MGLQDATSVKQVDLPPDRGSAPDEQGEDRIPSRVKATT